MLNVRYRQERLRPYTLGHVLAVRLEGLHDAELSFPVIYGTTKTSLRQLCVLGIPPGEDTKLRGQPMVRFIGFGYILQRKVWYPPALHPDCEAFIVLDLSRWLLDKHSTLLTQECIVETPHWISPIYFLSIVIGKEHHPDKQLDK